MKNQFKIAAITFFAFIMAGVISCDDRSDATGRIRIQMTDAPFPTDMVAEANVTVTKIEARQQGAEDGVDSFITLSEEETSLNLLDLTNGLTVGLVDMEVPVGAYDLIRVYVSDASIVLTDDQETTYAVKVPGGSSSGIKIFFDPVITVSGSLTADLLLDFDVSKSFILQGNMDTPAGIKGFSFKPVIKGANISTSGSLTGTVTDEEELGLEGAQVSLYAADTLNTTTFTGEEGGYMILGLEPGVYEVEIELEGYESSAGEDLGIVVGNATTFNATLVAIEEPEGE